MASAHPRGPLRVGTRGSPLALVQARGFMALLRDAHAALREPGAVAEQVIRTTGDAVQDRPLADIGGKGLFSKEIHEALSECRIDCAVHSLKDLETALPPGIVLACTLAREDARDALILGPACAAPDPADPYAALPHGGVVGTSSVRRRAQLLHARPDLRTGLLRGNVQTRLGRVRAGDFAATVLAFAGLRRLGLAGEASAVLDAELMVPAAGQGIVGVTARAGDDAVLELLAGVGDPASFIAAAAERALLAELDGSCRTPIGGHATVTADGTLELSGLVARADGGFLLRRRLGGRAGEAAALGRALGRSLRADSPRDLFA
jgi:hydroxymethylbilane synthase